MTNGQTPAQVALGYRDSLNAYLGGAGFRAYFSPGYTTNNVRLTKITNGTFFATAESTTAGEGRLYPPQPECRGRSDRVSVAVRVAARRLHHAGLADASQAAYRLTVPASAAATRLRLNEAGRAFHGAQAGLGLTRSHRLDQAGYNRPPCAPLRSLRGHRRLGMGSFGEVYLARSRSWRATWRSRWWEASGNWSRREALDRCCGRHARWRRLQHPGLVTVYDVGSADDEAWVVMEYVPGETLRHRLERRPLPLAEVVRLGTALCGRSRSPTSRA